MKQYFISTANFQELVKKLLNESPVIAPVKSFKNSHFEQIDAKNLESIDVSGFRTVEPFKSYLFKLIEKTSEYFVVDKAPNGQNLTIIGARGCDLEALEVLDKVFGEGDFIDPFYKANRENILVIGTDCTDCGKTCFCTMVNGKPYPVKMFDLNLAPIKDGFVAEAGSDKGAKLLDDNPMFFLSATSISLDEKNKNREKVIGCLEENNKNYRLKLELSVIHKRNIENKIWKVLTKDCVECSSCNFICPTCSCFLLLDQKSPRHSGRDKEDDNNERYKVWDACLKAGYQKVAGGSNPRGRLSQRLQNRYHCKFDYSYDRLNRYTCVGCGRCIDGCAGNIDMRKIFVELEKQAPLTAKLE